MEKRHQTLKRGVELTTLGTDKFKGNLLTVNISTELKKDTASLNSLLTDVLSSSCEKYPTLKQFNHKLAELYAASVSAFVFKRGENDVLSFGISFLDGKYAFDSTDLLKECTAFLGEVLFRPLLIDGAFSKDVVEREKKNLCDAIDAEKNNKTSYAVTRCNEEMCKDEPYSVSVNGDKDIVNAITPKSLYDHYINVLNTSKIDIYYVGGANTDDVISAVNEFLPFEERVAKLPQTIVISKANDVKEITEEFPISQGKLSLGFRTGITFSDESYFAFPLFLEIFGLSPSSKLFMNVREKMSLCYYCRPIADTLKGVLVVTSGINIADKEKAQKAILEQLAEMQNGNITDDEIENGRRSLTNAYKEISDSPSSLISWYFTRSLASKCFSPAEAIEQLNKVTKEDIVAIAHRLSLDTVYFMTGDGTEEIDDEEE